MKQQVINGLKIIVLGLTLSAGISYATNWIAPAGSPPGNNAEGPVNVGTSGQLKNGGLGVQGFVAWDNALFAKDVFIKDPLNPSNKGNLEVSGNTTVGEGLVVGQNTNIGGNLTIGDVSTDPAQGGVTQIASLTHSNSTDTHVCADQNGVLFLCGGTPPPPVDPQCDDGIDNDADGDIDFPQDTGCTSPLDNSEAGGVALSQCNDGIDNDGDSTTDFGNDVGCLSATDSSEKEVIQVVYTKNPSTGALTITGSPSNFQTLCSNCAPTSGITRFLTPKGLTQVMVTVVGGGGGGGGASVDDEYIGTLYGTNCVPLQTCLRRAGGGGGGAGGVTISTVTVAPEWLYTISVGSGGSQGTEDAWTQSSANFGSGGNGGNSFFSGNPTAGVPAVNINVTGGQGGKGAFAIGSATGFGGLKGTGLSNLPQNGFNAEVLVHKFGSLIFGTGTDGGGGGSTGVQGSYGNGGFGGDALAYPSPVCNNSSVCRGDSGRPGAVIVDFSI